MVRREAKGPSIELDRAQIEPLVHELKRMLADRFDAELGGLEVEEMLAFIGERLGPLYYNKAIADTQALLSERFDSLESDVWALEKH
ncbi:DUF2164 domain-containing protein [Pseudomonas sp. Marseille-QA0892]